MRVRVYRNLHADSRGQGRWSVMAWQGPRKSKVIKHLDNVILADCKFIVQQSGRERVIREQRKNVHAFIEGDMKPSITLNGYDSRGAVKYNPYTSPTPQPTIPGTPRI